jgi:hypothetical protein
MGDPDFLYAALETTACAAFITESRMKCINANQLHRKSGGSPTTAFVFPPHVGGIFASLGPDRLAL